MMQIIPAIDLKDGACVRLKQGLMEDSTVFSTRPEEMAQHWLHLGAKRLHLVDLNGAFVGEPKNKTAILAILKSLNGKIPVELGGGIRDLKTLEMLFDWGIQWAILGTIAVENPAFVQEANKHFPDRIIIGIDAKNGWVATDGWAKTSQHRALDFAKRFEDCGTSAIIYTDIARDGMLCGINLEETQKMAENLSIPVIASGGLANLKDIENLKKIPKIFGVIAGRAIYTGALDFQAALTLAGQ